MVFAKVTDGKEIRKLQIGSDITFSALKEQIARLFPSLSGGADFSLQYRDADGDIISISTDEEVRTALSHLPSGETWLLQAVPKRAIQRAQSRSGAPTRSYSRELGPFGFGGNFLGRIFDDIDPFWTPSSSLMDWSDPFGRRYDEEAKAIEEKWRRETEQLRKMQEEHMKQFEEQRKKAEADIQKALSQRRESNTGGAVQPAKGGEPRWNVQTFGSWDPQVVESPFGNRTLIGPVGYHMYWGYSDPEQQDQPQTEEKPAQQGDASGDTPAAPSC